MFPSVERSKSASERKTRILERSTSLTRASKVRSTAWTASTASANTLWPYGDISTLVLVTAGLTMPKVG